MLIGDVLGLPLMPWVLAEPVGKAAAKLPKEIPNEVKKKKKKLKRAGADPAAAEAAVLSRRVPLNLPSSDEIKAAWKRVAKAKRQEESAAAPAAPAPAAPAPSASPAPESTASAHECSDACSAGMCPRAKAVRWCTGPFAWRPSPVPSLQPAPQRARLGSTSTQLSRIHATSWRWREIGVKVVIYVYVRSHSDSCIDIQHK